ncbi:cysteine desulfurase family protein [Siminovitchia sp. 179-K 8D1 HS]|uniref:cysteine desulfurase family protein n=1 Tax=Siminovitchia sp. 179-K 8D1 HS TaxID=3142385 RepID=UPI0039A1953E
MIYFDNSATTKPYEAVLEAFVDVGRQFYGNPSSLHVLGGKAEKLLTKAREQIAHLAGAAPGEIYFTSGGSEGNNLAIKGTALMYRDRGKHIITTSVEHPSVREACEQLRALGYKITYIPVNKDGHIDPDDILHSMTDQTILVSVIHVNNEVGTIQPVTQIGKLLKKYPKVLYHVDHVQGAAKVPLDLHDSHIDICTFSAHKFHGLKGNGFVFIRKGVTIAPLISGGNQENGMRSGTENTAGIVAMAKAFRMAEEKRKSEMEKLLEIRTYLMNEFKKMPELLVHTPDEQAAPHIINVSCVGLKGEVAVHGLSEEGVIVSTTSACSSKDKTPSGTLKAMGVSDPVANGAIRISLSYENTMDEAKQMVDALQKVLARLTKVMRRNG